MYILPSSLISNNATLKAFDIGGLLHPVKPIEQLTPIIFNNLEPGKLHKFNLNIDYALRLKTYQLHLKIAEETAFFSGEQDLEDNQKIMVLLKSINSQNKVKDKLVFTFPINIPDLIFLPQTTWIIYPFEHEISRLIFYCEPFVTFPPIEFNFSSLTEVII